VTPPARAPHYFDNQQYGWPTRQCAIHLVSTLANWTHPAVTFSGDAEGRIWREHSDGQGSARLRFSTKQGDGVVELSAHESDWVRAEVLLNGALVLRVWLDEPYEEKEFWPDGADGIVPPDSDPPGRFSKRGAWLQLRCAAFPGVPDKGNGYWAVESTD